MKFKRLFGPVPRYPHVENYTPPISRNDLIVVAGPCSVESPEQIDVIAETLSKNDAQFLRGGIFRAGTYPNANVQFGPVPEELMKFYHRTAEDYGMKNIIEVLDYGVDHFEKCDSYASAFQVGARQMQNYMLLKILAQFNKPVFLKRSMGATMDEWLGAAEWLLASGLRELYLIERGSCSHLNHVRWEPSISIIPAVKCLTKIPILIDASHSTGRRDLIEPVTLAGIAAGADGCLIETHYDPDNSLSDSEQATPLNLFPKIIKKARSVYDLLRLR